MASHAWRLAALVLGATAFAAGPAFGLDVLDGNYVAESYSSYDTSGMAVFAIGFSFDGNLYLGHAYSGETWRISPDGKATRLLTPGITHPRGFAAISHALYGDGMFVANAGEPRTIGILQPDGTSRAYTGNGSLPTPNGMAMDITGRYGGRLFFVSNGTDGVYSVDQQGKLARAERHFSLDNASGPFDLAFDPSGRFGRRLFVAYDDYKRMQTGLYTVEPNGVTAVFAPKVVSANWLAFDARGRFGLDLFVVGRTHDDANSHLMRVGPGGEEKPFAVVRDRRGYASASVRDIEFGPDGALYVCVNYNQPKYAKVHTRVYRIRPRRKR